MKELYLEVTFRHGRPMAAYLYLPRRADEKSASTKRVEPGMVIDFSPRGNPIGIEITAPGLISLVDINGLLESLELPPIAKADLAPLLAA
ncbi:MAG TPA: DUF2283 domain-containing protein [Thermoanaerobaculia bacterium]|nr:DUF2283 domain-containing protein [Thermoanaerobaculia bacterium]